MKMNMLRNMLTHEESMYCDVWKGHGIHYTAEWVFIVYPAYAFGILSALGRVLCGSVELPLASVNFFHMRTNTYLFMCLNSVRERRSGRFQEDASTRLVQEAATIHVWSLLLFASSISQWQHTSKVWYQFSKDPCFETTETKLIITETWLIRNGITFHRQ
jgi:hypothetical protein